MVRLDLKTGKGELLDGAAKGAAPDPATNAGRRALLRQLTPSGDRFLRDRQFARHAPDYLENSDGREIEGLLTVPPESVARPPYKLLLHPHGGPHSRSTSGYNLTVQIIAAQGYAVFQPNFRGSEGYGQKFIDADRFDFGGGDMRDILTGIDHLIREKIVDRDRQFVYGTSYGGFMTCWLVGHTNQFRAAVAQNAVTELNVLWGLGDLQSWTEWEFGGRPWEVPAAMRQAQPANLRGQRPHAYLDLALARGPPLSHADGANVLPGPACPEGADPDGDLPRRGPRHSTASAPGRRTPADPRLVPPVRSANSLIRPGSGVVRSISITWRPPTSGQAAPPNGSTCHRLIVAMMWPENASPRHGASLPHPAMVWKRPRHAEKYLVPGGDSQPPGNWSPLAGHSELPFLLLLAITHRFRRSRRCFLGPPAPRCPSVLVVFYWFRAREGTGRAASRSRTAGRFVVRRPRSGMQPEDRILAGNFCKGSRGGSAVQVVRGPPNSFSTCCPFYRRLAFPTPPAPSRTVGWSADHLDRACWDSAARKGIDAGA